jgi:hypothetical protein
MIKIASSLTHVMESPTFLKVYITEIEDDVSGRRSVPEVFYYLIFIVDGRIILKRIFKKRVGDMDWIELAQDRDRWRALVNAVINLRVP